jgi:hypothetical protein
MSDNSIKSEAQRRLLQQASKERLEAEQAKQKAELERELQESRIREERTRLYAEEETIRIKVRQLALEDEAKRLADEKEAAVQAEIVRLQNRTPVEVLQEKVADLTNTLIQVKQELQGQLREQTTQTSTSLETRVKDLVEKNETHLVGFWSYVDNKVAALERVFEERVKEREDAIWTKLYYFRTFRLRILKNRGGVECTRTGYITCKGRVKQTNLNRQGSITDFYHESDILKNAKITYNGMLDTVEIYKDQLTTQHPNPVVYIRFTEPTFISWFGFSKYPTAKPDNAQWQYDHQGMPSLWILEASNNERDWVELYNMKMDNMNCVNGRTSPGDNFCTYGECPYHKSSINIGLNVYG